MVELAVSALACFLFPESSLLMLHGCQALDRKMWVICKTGKLFCNHQVCWLQEEAKDLKSIGDI